jgi:hypothetical protein
MSMTVEEMLASFQAKIQDINAAMDLLEQTLRERVIEREQLINRCARLEAALSEIIREYEVDDGSFNYGSCAKRALGKQETCETYQLCDDCITETACSEAGNCAIAMNKETH